MMISSTQNTRNGSPSTLLSLKSRTLLFLFVLVFSGAGSGLFAQSLLGEYTFNGNVGSTNLAATNVAAGLTFAPAARVGVNTASGNLLYDNNFSSSNWATPNAVNVNKYHSFKITATPGNYFSLYSFSFQERISGVLSPLFLPVGPRTFEVRSSVDNFATPIDVVTGLDPNPFTLRTHSYNLVLPGYTNLTSVEFRIYGYNAGATGGFFSQDNVEFTGDVYSTPLANPMGIYLFTNNTGTNDVGPSNVLPNTIFSNYARTGVNLPNNHGTGGFASNFPIGGFNAGRYHSFTVEPGAGYTMTLEQIDFYESRSGGGPRRWELRSSVDNFATSIATFNIPDNTQSRRHFITLPSASFTNVNQVEFRFYAYNSDIAIDLNRNWRQDDVLIRGFLTPVAPTPDVATGPGGVENNLILWLKGENYDGATWANAAVNGGVGNALDIDSNPEGGLMGGGSSTAANAANLPAFYNNNESVYFSGADQLYIADAYNLNGRDLSGATSRRFDYKTAIVAYSPELTAYPDAATTRAVVYEQGARDIGLNFYTDVTRNGATGSVDARGAIHNDFRNKPFDGFSSTTAVGSGYTPFVVSSVSLNKSTYESSVIAGSKNGAATVGFNEVIESNSTGHTFLGTHGGFTGIGGINGAIRYNKNNYNDPIFGTAHNVIPAAGPATGQNVPTSQNDPFIGHISEVVQFDGQLNYLEFLFVRNYFASKYGYTAPLYNGFVTDIFNGDVAPYNCYKDLAGVGAIVDQATVYSEKTEGRGDNYLTVLNPQGMAVNPANRGAAEILTWAHDNADMSSTITTGLPAGFNNRWARIYAATQIDNENSDGTEEGVGLVTLAFKLEGLGSINPNHIKLLVKPGQANPGTFTGAGVTVYSHATWDGVNLVFHNVNLARPVGSWVNLNGFSTSRVSFTLASTNAATQLRTGGALLRTAEEIAAEETANELKNEVAPFNFVMYPNPTRSNLNFRFENAADAATTVQITDMMGRVVLETADRKSVV